MLHQRRASASSLCSQKSFIHIMNKKKKQHYVWRSYLRPWSNKERIWCLRENKIFHSNLMGVAQEKYFYRIKELTDIEVGFIRRIAVERSSGPLREANIGWIQMFDALYELKRKFGEVTILNEDADRFFETMEVNFQEEFYSYIEGFSNKYLTSLYDKDLSFYETEEGAMDFCFFIVSQYLRTKTMETNICESFGSVEGIDIKKCWSVMRHIFTTNVAWSLYADRDNLRPIVVENKTEKQLITGDQPVINIHAFNKEPDEEVDDFELYYPLGPNMALFISKRDSINEFSNEDDVEHYNQMIYQQSREQVYASQESDLFPWLTKNEA